MIHKFKKDLPRRKTEDCDCCGEKIGMYWKYQSHTTEEKEKKVCQVCVDAGRFEATPFKSIYLEENI